MRTRGLWQPVTVSLRRLFPSASFVGCGDIRVSEATDQSAVCAAGGLFAAVRGTRHDGLGYVDAALERGAGSLLVPHPVSTAEVPQCIVHDVRAAYAVLCQAVAGHPSRRLNVAGITGTDGKTTVAWLLRSIWQAAGHPTGLMGTIEYDDGGHTQQADLTTPGPDTLASWLAAMVARGTTHAAVELSSHALDQDRAAGVGLDVAVLTNLTQDHFDYHGDLANYAAAKSRILDLCDPAGIVVFNADDSRINTMISPTAGDRIGDRTLLSFGIEADADFTARIVDESVSGTRFRIAAARSHRNAGRLDRIDYQADRSAQRHELPGSGSRSRRPGCAELRRSPRGSVLSPGFPVGWSRCVVVNRLMCLSISHTPKPLCGGAWIHCGR